MRLIRKKTNKFLRKWGRGIVTWISYSLIEFIPLSLKRYFLFKRLHLVGKYYSI